MRVLVESNLIYPSLSSFLKAAEILAVDISSFSQGSVDVKNQESKNPGPKDPDLVYP